MIHNAMLKLLYPTMVMASACLAQSAVLLSEDFESYAGGSSLSGQGGWTGGDIRIGDSPSLGSRVLDGFQPGGTPGWLGASHPLARALDPAEVTRFSFTAHTLPFPMASSGSVGLQTPTGFIGWNIMFFQYPEWIFQAPASGDRIFLSALNFTGTLGLVVDGPTSQVYGFLESAQGGIFPTRSIFIDPQLISTIGSVGVYMPPGSGIQVDNLKVEVVPEPSMWLLLPPALGLLFFRHRKLTRP